MCTASPGAARLSTEIEGNVLHFGATNCTNVAAQMARAVWPDKTAEHWAAAAGVQPRVAKYWLARGASEAGRIALIRQLVS